MKLFTGVILSILSIALGAGCSAPSGDNPQAIATARNAAYHRSAIQFPEAAFYKPTENWTDDLGVRLAPLLFHELSTNHPPAPPELVRLGSNAEEITTEAGTPVVYFRKEKLYLKGAERDRAVFLWFYRQGEKIVPQGVRITLDSDGHPALWEVLHDTSGIYQIFASQSLEALARKQFGEPLVDRQSALEHPVSSAPNVVVSRVISDGPMAMGPAIYLEAKQHDVATLICRCMPPQVQNIATTSLYEVLNLDDPANEKLVRAALRKAMIPSRNWLSEGAEEMDLRLRLPQGF